MNENFSEDLKRVLKISKNEAIRLGHSYIGSEHFLLGVLKDKNGKASKLISTLGISNTEMISYIETISKPKSGSVALGHLPLTRRAEKILRNTAKESKNRSKDSSDQIDFLLSLANEKEGLAFEALNTFSISYDSIIDILPTENYSNENKISNIKKSDTPTLDSFSRDVSVLAEDGKLDPIIGRDEEINRMAQILSRRKKNNPVLIGEPGVGKTAIVEGLALKICEKTVPRLLWGTRILVLDLPSLIAGTKYRGQFEERLKNLMIELESTSDTIVFIDEIHTIVGAGGATGSLDAANMFKPALARGEIQIIGATTLNEYRKYIEKDGALERRFQKIIVSQPSFNDTINILNGIKSKYEKHHDVSYSSEAIKACVELSDKYITDKYLPDKAIDVLDEVGSHVRITNINIPDNILKLEKQIKSLKHKKEKVVSEQKFEEAALLRDKERKLTSKYDIQYKDWVKDENVEKCLVSEDDVADVVSLITGIPVSKVAESETDRLLNMAKNLRKRIIGQEHSLEIVSKAIIRARAGLKNPNHPIGSFLFLGPTGVGKTELAKALSEYLFQNDESFIKIDMSEYMERFNISRLLGAPPGYVGYDEGGQLTERVRRYPFSVVLFDEIEKAHKDIYNILLQILDEGTLMDSLGNKVDFSNTIIILTSNIGTKALQSSSLGFHKKSKENQANISSEINLNVKKYFSPELLNRLDELIIFNSLNKDNLFEIIDLQLKDLKRNLLKFNNTFSITKSAKEYLLINAKHQEWGARPIRRVIQNLIENEISERFINGIFKNNQGIIKVHFKNSSLTFSQVLKSSKKIKKSIKG